LRSPNLQVYVALLKIVASFNSANEDWQNVPNTAMQKAKAMMKRRNIKNSWISGYFQGELYSIPILYLELSTTF